MALYGTGSSPKIEALISGTWTDISSRVRGEQKCEISRGRADEQGRTAAQRCRLTLENTDGYFSTRLPTSANYGLIGRNTQLRVAAGTGDNYLALPFNDQTDLVDVRTADKASLDIVGDIDVRAEIWPHTWRPGTSMVIGSKYQIASNQRSWVFYLSGDGYLSFAWTTDGTLATRVTATASSPISAFSGRLAVRFTLDVNNGAAGKDYAFYTSTSISGTWTQIGTTTTSAGTTTIFSGAGDLTWGAGDDNRSIYSDGIGFGGRIYAAEVYSGIGGTKVANMVATTQAIGATSWVDASASPNTWTVTSPARVTSARLRFWGELASLPKRSDKSGVDVNIPAVASGLIRRLGQGAVPLKSPMYRNLSQYDPHGYWTLEDDNGSTVAASAVSGGRPAIPTAVTFAAADTLPGAASTVQFTASTSKIVGYANSATAGTTASFVMYVKLSGLPASTKTFCTLSGTGTVRNISIGITAGSWYVEFYDQTGASLGLANTTITSINPTNQWVGYNLLLDTSGGNVTYSVRWDVVGGTFGGGIGPTSLGAGTVGRFSSFVLTAKNDAAFNDAQFGQVFMSTQSLDLTTDNFRNSANAYLGETAAARIDRLCTEEDAPFEITGFYSDTETMGYQTVSSFMDLLYECSDADGGPLYESRDSLAICYRSRVDLERREDVSLSYTSSHLAEVPESLDDDQGFTNDVTVGRTGGGSARSVVETGPTSILAPPDGTGRYNNAYTLNVEDDVRLPSIAGWLTTVGSWDQDRYPNVTVAMHRTELTGNTALSELMIGLDIGDTAVLTGLPSWMPPDSIPELVQGYTETLSKFTWDVVLNCTPAGPYRQVVLLGANATSARLDAAAHTIGATLTTTATSIALVTPAGSQRWVDTTGYPAEFPFDVRVAGEVWTVTAISGTSSPQTATITRSVNGVVKAHASGETIRLADPFFLAR